MPSPPSPRGVPRDEGLIARYEELRQQALGWSSAIPRGRGLALVMRSGVAGWMQAWAQDATVVAAPAKEWRDDRDATFPLALHREVTMILTAMVFQGWQEASA